jgi:integrase
MSVGHRIVDSDEDRTDLLDRFRASKSKGKHGSGQYQKNAGYVIESWAEWLNEQEGIVDVEDVTVPSLRRWARDELGERVRSGEIAASTAHRYYAYVSAFLTWCVREQLIDSNPADTNEAQEELPADSSTSSQKNQNIWTAEHRQQIMRHVDERAVEAIDENGLDAGDAVRERALAAMLAYSGARGAELLRDPDDAREGRQGATWGDMNTGPSGGTILDPDDAEELLERDWTVDVLGKSGAEEVLPVGGRACRPLLQWAQVQDPPSPEWPIFPTGHVPTLYGRVRTVLTDRGLSEDEVEAIIEKSDSVDDLLRERGIVPPALTTNGGRSVMKRLTEEAGIDAVNGEYLKPHGGRRGLGDTLYREQGSEAAQHALRHADPSVTSEAYQYIETSESVADIDAATENE